MKYRAPIASSAVVRSIVSGLLVMATSGIAFAVGIPTAPEIDPSSAISGLTLLMGGVAVLRARRR